MKKMNTYLTSCFAALILTVCALSAQAQTAPSYKDLVVDNPTAEKDMKTVGDYVNALTAGDLKKAKSMLDKTYMSYGPTATDSSTVEQEMKSWEQNYKTQSDRKVGFITQTFKVTTGPQKGSWVSLWGNYTFTTDGKTITFPFQLTASVSNGKITKSFIYFERLSILQQLGYTLTPPAVVKK
jgi:ketosteroid isomerase-like protein